MVNRAHFRPFVERARQLPPLPAAFVYPCDRDTLQLAVSAAFTGTLAPVLVGPEARIQDVAGKAGIDIAQFPIVDTADDPRTAAHRAAALARSGRIRAWVRGSLGLDELVAPLLAADSDLRGTRRLSHADFLDLPGHPRGVLVADARLNLAPGLAAKRDIVQNTIDFARALGVAAPQVALLAALDVVHPAVPSTGDAALLAGMAARGQFGAATVAGPLMPDVALFEAAARGSGRAAAVAGRADVLIAPSMEAAALLVRALTGITGGLAAGLILGATLPVVAGAASDTMEARMASCVLAALLAAAMQADAGTATTSGLPARADAPAVGLSP